jgi:hypothetical protein
MSRARTTRRAAERALAKDARDRARLAEMSPGGAPTRPIEVASASVIEPSASSTPCALCEGTLRIEEHAAETAQGVRLRVVRLRCTRCSATRSIWFRIVAPSIH